jgi:hypothetical protein
VAALAVVEDLQVVEDMPGRFIHPRTGAWPARISCGFALGPSRYAPEFEQFQEWLANTQTEDTAREIYDGVVCESGRVECEMLLATLNLSKVTVVDYAAVTTPVLVIVRRVRPHRASTSRAQSRSAVSASTCVEIVRSDHMVFSGDALSVTMSHIDDWAATNRILANG